MGWHRLARQTAEAGNDLLAIRYYERALALGANPALYLDMGNTYAHMGETLRAIQCYGKGLHLDPDSGQTWNNFGNLFLQLKDTASATLCYRNAARLLADDGALYSLGRVLDLTGRHAEALTHLRRACELNPSHVDAWTNLGNAHLHLGHLDEALRIYDRALALSDHPAELHVNRAMILLNQGDFRQGWSEYEQRWETAPFSVYKRRPFGRPQWKGEPLSGKRIFLHAEQGLGDSIQFARFIPEVSARALEVFLEVSDPLKSLMEGLLDREHILSRKLSLPEFEYHCSLMSLPVALQLEIGSIPADPYLHLPEQARAEARQAIDHATNGRPSLRVGISWKGNPTHRWDQLRSLKPVQLSPLAAVQGVQWFLLQQDATPEELASFPKGFAIATLPPKQLDGFLATAALIQELDLVISVDTVTAHLAGALGKPLWLLIPAFYDWRWHSHLPNSPWYPSAKLFRQHEPGAWTGAIESLASALSELAGRQQIELGADRERTLPTREQPTRSFAY